MLICSDSNNTCLYDMLFGIWCSILSGMSVEILFVCVLASLIEGLTNSDAGLMEKLVPICSIYDGTGTGWPCALTILFHVFVFVCHMLCVLQWLWLYLYSLLQNLLKMLKPFYFTFCFCRSYALHILMTMRSFVDFHNLLQNLLKMFDFLIQKCSGEYFLCV